MALNEKAVVKDCFLSIMIFYAITLSIPALADTLAWMLKTIAANPNIQVIIIDESGSSGNTGN